MYEIIYVDDSLADRRVASTAHKESGIKAPLRTFSSGTTFLAYVDRVPADDSTTRVVLINLELAGDGGLDVLRKLKMRTASARMLVWMFGDSQWKDDREPYKKAGAVRFLSKPADSDLSIELFRELGKLLEPSVARRSPTPGALGRVLLIEDNEMDAVLLRENLKDVLPELELVRAATLADGHELLNQTTFDGLILDMHLPDAQDTMGLVSIISAWPQVPIVVISGIYDESLGRAAIRSGAQDFVSKSKLDAGSLILLLEFAIERQHILNKLRLELSRTRADSFTDALTGLPNRRALQDAYRSLPVNIDEQADSSCALVVVDIDGLKTVNDLYGHKLGDELIQLVAATLKSRLRTGDLLARVGGDEFVVLLLDLPQGDWVDVLVGRMRAAIEAIPPLAGSVIRPQASFGIAMVPTGGASFDDIFALADARMYQDKSLRRGPAGAEPVA